MQEIITKTKIMMIKVVGEDDVQHRETLAKIVEMAVVMVVFTAKIKRK